jgi:DNA-binding CsgD family transcriptional regulator
MDKIAVAEREARALALRRDGHTYAEIGQALGINRQMATRIVQRGLRRIPVENAEQARAVELLTLNHLQVQALAVLRRRHYFVQGGEVVKRSDPETGEEEELLDDGPVLAAISCVLRVQQRRAALLGLDAPTEARVLADIRLADAWRRSTPEQHAKLLDEELVHLETEMARRSPAMPPAAETITSPTSEPDDQALAEAVAAGLHAVGVELDAAAVERLGVAIEGYLDRRNGGGR